MDIDKKELQIIMNALKTYRDMRKSMKLGDWKDVDQLLEEIRNEKKRNKI